MKTSGERSETEMRLGAWHVDWNDVGRCESEKSLSGNVSFLFAAMCVLNVDALQLVGDETGISP